MTRPGQRAAPSFSPSEGWTGAVRALALLGLAIGLLALLGRLAGAGGLLSWGVDAGAMATESALGVVAVAVAVLLTLTPGRPRAVSIGRRLGAVLAAITLVGLLATVVGLDVRIDRPGGDPGRFSPSTGIASLLLGTAVALGGAGRARVRRLGTALSLTALGLAVIALCAIGFQVGGLVGVDAVDDMALPAAVALLALALAVLMARPEEGPAALLRDPGAGGRVARWLLPVTVLVPVALSLALFLPRDRGWIDPSAAEALFVAASLLLPTALVLGTACSVRRLDRQRGRAVAALERERRFLEAVLESVSEGVVACDAESDLVIVNRSLRALHGLPEEGPPSEGWAIWSQLRAPDGQTSLEVEDLPLVRALAGLEVRERESTVLGELGWRIVLANGRPVTDRAGAKLGAVVSLRDVTESRRVDEELRRSSARFRTLSLQAPVGIYELDAGGGCVFVNRSWARMAGLSEDAALGDGWAQAIHPHDRARVMAGWSSVARWRGEVTDDFRLKAPDGRVTWVEGRIRPLHGPDDEVVGWIGVATDITERRRAEMEQAALSRIATAVAGDGPREDVLDLVAEQAARALEVDAVCVVGFGTESRVEASWSTPGLPRLEVGTALPATGGTAAVQVRLTGAPARIERHDRIDQIESGVGGRAPWAGPPWQTSMAAPIRVGSATWGALAAANATAGPFAPGAEERLERFASLLALAIATADARAQLESLASTDHLTGLPNRRAFYERLMSEAERARRHGRPLSLVVMDVDHFKRVNDTYGHEVGDRVLGELASRLAAEARVGEVMARVGGEEFAWILPDADGLGAYLAAERARRAIAAAPFAQAGGLTMSAGVSDLAQAEAGAAELFRFADLALYWAKANGRNATFRYSTEVEGLLSAEEQSRRLAREQAMGSIRGLAQAVDGKDASTLRHSERVADLAEQLALASGWSPDRASLLRHAGLVHDVGRVGVPDAILLKPGPLDAGELARVRQHPALGAQIVAEALTAEQTDWVHHHRERVDGGGYPDGLSGSQLSDGACLLALADAWDAMTSDRPYRPAMAPRDALAECRRQKGRQFAVEAVEALERLRREGLLPDLVVPAQRS